MSLTEFRALLEVRTATHDHILASDPRHSERLPSLLPPPPLEKLAFTGTPQHWERGNDMTHYSNCCENCPS
jgi:hypothetical protein